MADESTPSDPYELVLADLKAKRDQIDQMIQNFEAFRAGGAMRAVSATSVAGSFAPNAPTGGPGALLGMTISEAAKKILTSRREPMRNPDIAAAFKAGGLVLNSADPVNTIGAVLTRRFNEVGDIVKIGRGTWGLKEWYPNRSFKKGETKSETNVPAQPSKPKLVVPKP